MMPAAISSIDGFNRSYIPEPNSGCWLWERALNNMGYGLLQCGGFKGYAHRFSFQHFAAEPADITGLHICHRCDNPSCVNPDHLFAGTASQNMRDCMSKGRHASQNNTTKYARGVEAGPAKLNPDAVRKIRSLKGVIGARKIAKAFGVTRGAIREIHAGRTWAHV